MGDVLPNPSDAAEYFCTLSAEEVPRALQTYIAEGRLSGVIRDLNAAIFSGDPDRKTAAEDVLRHIGFL